MAKDPAKYVEDFVSPEAVGRSLKAMDITIQDLLGILSDIAHHEKDAKMRIAAVDWINRNVLRNCRKTVQEMSEPQRDVEPSIEPPVPVEEDGAEEEELEPVDERDEAVAGMGDVDDMLGEGGAGFGHQPPSQGAFKKGADRE